MDKERVTEDARRTERVDPRYAGIDSLPPAGSLRLQLDAQREALDAIERALGQIERAVNAATAALNHSEGRIIYAGAGTSGRLGIQDGVELTPTFNWPKERCVYLMAGGLRAVFRSVEGAEDNAGAGVRRMKSLNPGRDDVVIGIAASGTTPFTIGAVTEARKAGSVTISIANNPAAPLLTAAEFPICVESGPEVISGSTRLKAGTTQKVVLNMISNQIMIGLNKVHDGMMVDMRPSNEKLKERAVAMVRRIAGCTAEDAAAALKEADNRIKAAVLVAAFRTSAEGANRMLEREDGNLRACLDAGRAFQL